MPYVIPPHSPDTFLDEEYDRCDVAMRRGDVATIKNTVAAVLSESVISPERRLWAVMFRGIIAYWENRDEEAVQSLTEAMTGPELIRSRSAAVLALLKLRRGDVAGALALLEPERAAGRASSDLLLALAAVKTASNAPGEAWSAYCDAVALDPGSFEAVRGMVGAGMVEERLSAVEGALRGFLKIEPENLSARAYLAGCLVAQGKLDEARRETFRFNSFGELAPVLEECREIIRQIAPLLEGGGRS